jgi:hypothetical protein
MIILLIFIIIIIYFINKKYIECFDNKNIKCCKINKVIYNDNNLLKSKYIYQKLENDKCNPDKYILNHEQQLYIEGINNWSNNDCNENSLGSCKKNNLECMDFMKKDSCTMYNMTWFNNTCYDKFKGENKIDINYNNSNKINKEQIVKLF